MSSKSKNKLRINMIASSIYQVFIMIVPILTTPYVTRIFDVEQMGVYSLSLTISGLFVVIAQFGLPTYGSREIAVSKSKFEDNQKFFYLESIQIFVSIVSFIMYNLIFLVLFDFGNKLLFFTQSFLIIANIFDISWYYVGIEEIDKLIVRNGATKLLATALIFVFIRNDDQLVTYALINVLGMFIGNFVMIFQSFKFINYQNKFFKLKFSIFKSSFLLLLPQLINSSFSSIENSVLSFKTSNANVGIYSESKKIVNLLNSIIQSAFTALSPRMSYFVSLGEFNKLRALFDKGVLISNIFSIVIVVGIITVADDFVDFFYGAGYELVAEVLKISSIGVIFAPVVILISRGILIPYGKDREYTNSILVLLVSGTFFNLLLDFQLGAKGAAISFCLSQLFSLCYILVVSRKIISIKSLILKFLSTILVIGVDVLLVNFIATFFVIKNPFISFVILGLLSTFVSLLSITPVYLYKIILNLKGEN